MIVYGDLLFLINFSMDFLCFYLTCLLLHLKMPTFRVCFASVIGGIYSVVALFVAQKVGNALLLDISVLAFMCLVVFGKKGTKIGKLVKYSVIYLFVSALLGGLMTALFNLFNKFDTFFDSTEIKEGIDVWIFSLLAILGAIFTMNGGKLWRTSMSRRNGIVEIESDYGSARLKTLVDSGNLVHEPISGKSVVFASLTACKDVLSDEMYKALLLSFDMDKMPNFAYLGMRFVPSETISGNVILPALKFKKVTVKYEKRRKEIDVYIAFLRDELASGYDAIISQEAII